MCLAIPAKVEQIQGDDLAIISVGGIKKQISLMLVDDVQEGDYVIVHVGYALNKLDPEEAQKTLELFRQAADKAGMKRPGEQTETGAS